MSAENDDTISQIESNTDQQSIKEIIESEPLYYVLGQFLQSSNNKNITTIFEEFTIEMRKMNETLKNIQLSLASKSDT
jgi:uncharacterized protein YsxB (DUF464 family)